MPAGQDCSNVADLEFGEGVARDMLVGVDVKDTGGNIVVHAGITRYLCPRKRIV